MAEPFQRYFMAILPPEPIYSEADDLKKYFSNQYQSKASLNSPPHITLHMPFRYKERHESRLIEGLESFGKTRFSFELELRNFNAFIPRVIYIDVTKNETLQLFQKDLERFSKRSFQLFNANRLDQAWHPHLTLAFRDLKKDAFQLAWQEFQSKVYDRKFMVNSFDLLRHDNHVWKSIRRFPFMDK